MSTREDPSVAGAIDAATLVDKARRELREARMAAGLSQSAVARAAGLSASAYRRLEHGALQLPSVEYLSRAARALGLELALRLYPSGVPVRDAGQLRLEADFRGTLGPGLVFRPEVPLPIPGDQRAWDGIVAADDGLAFAECEMRPADLQALLRRMEGKLRDDPRSRVLILVIRDSRHNRRVLADHREVLRPLLPLDTGGILRALRGGRLPRTSGLLVL